MSMAPQSRAYVNIDDDIAFIGEQLERLKELAEHKEAADIFGDEDIYDLSVRWGTALAGRLPRMAHYSSMGRLAEADERRFRVLCDDVRAALPLIERFKLARPTFAGSQDDRAGSRRRAKARRLLRN
ncbi:hypothetical protein [Mycobacterium sp. E3339]|uniref:hypothetical protein n=1 Tax=Mycobacterium sp. E3339 TaxID=1834146 RepID=UPI0012E87B8A|nr:hypothetical protein [Mycobacterium sp. E3339]